MKIDHISPRRDSVQTEALPPHIRGGVHPNLLAPDTVTFVLHVPHKPYVSVVGDFNGWDTRAHPMVSNGQGTWWITLKHPGATRYGYYVALDDTSHVWVSDPYATQVEWADSGGGSRSGNGSEMSEVWAVLQEPVDFAWSDDDWSVPVLRELVIYELCVRDFTGQWRHNTPEYGTFAKMLARVDYLVELGINAVELMPVQAFPGRSSWGYNPVFYFALADTYGTPEDFKRLVDACHQRGIAVLLDVAFNHAWGEHPYYRCYPPMYGSDGVPLDDWNPFFHHTPRAVNMWGGVDWDHFVPETTRYFQDVVRFWLQEYHVDGFRFDWACGVEYDHRDPMRPGFHPYHGISAIAWAARQAKPDCLLFGEYWSIDGTSPDKSAAKMIAETEVDACWNGNFHHTLDDVLNQRWAWEQKDIYRGIGGYREDGYSSATEIVNFTCSHDEVRLEHEVKFYSAGHIDRPAKMDLQTLVLTKAALGLIALFTAPGVPMIYAGQEYGEDAPRTIDYCPLDWDLLERAVHRAHYDLVRRLIRLRNVYPALCSDWILFYVDDFAETNVVRYVRWDDADNQLIVALNFAGDEKSVKLDVPHDGTWYDLITDVAYKSAAGRVAVGLNPWQGVILGANRC